MLDLSCYPGAKTEQTHGGPWSEYPAYGPRFEYVPSRTRRRSGTHFGRVSRCVGAVLSNRSTLLADRVQQFLAVVGSESKRDTFRAICAAWRRLIYFPSLLAAMKTNLQWRVAVCFHNVWDPSASFS